MICVYKSTKNDKTCTGEHYSLFAIRHVGTARLDMLVSTHSTRQTSRVVSRCDVMSQVEFGLVILGDDYYRLHIPTNNISAPKDKIVL